MAGEGSGCCRYAFKALSKCYCRNAQFSRVRQSIPRDFLENDGEFKDYGLGSPYIE